ncbi:MAG: ornithine carbamoyltransferase [Gammaproteobacteria bacterium]|nr:ornithine carbamoyltransferase [Gammaproteobacteria bacterium]
MTRHFISLLDLSPNELLSLLDRADQLKKEIKSGQTSQAMQGKTLALLFDKSSTRTRVSFEVGMNQMGGNALFLSPADAQIGRGEPIEDTARVISSMVDIIAIRTGSHGNIIRFTEYSKVPVINALTDFNHPCQLLADMMTVRERLGRLDDIDVAYVGDGNNMCHSWMIAARQFGFNIKIAVPKGFEPEADLLEACKDKVTLTNLPLEAIRDADVVVTDTWISMGQEDEQQQRKQVFESFTVDAKLMENAMPDAIFLHCLPAYRGYEVTKEVLEGPQSAVWDEAENRLHAQKALIEFLLDVKI